MEIKKNCKFCGKEFIAKYKEQIFCSCSCSVKYNNTKRKENGYTTKGKTKKDNCRNCGKEIEIGINTPKSVYLCEDCKKIVFPFYYKNRYECVCKICGNIFFAKNNNAKYCSAKCSNSDEEVKRKLSEKAKRGIENGTRHRWNVRRNVSSYPEKFWENVLNNNDINYEREHRIAEYGYFLDFLICVNDIKIDLEIDGKQHNYEERKRSDEIRDERLKNLGYVVYRVPWNNINNENGKLLMKDKIDSFIRFLNDIKVGE